MYVPFAPRNYLHSNALKFQAKDSSDIGNLFKSISNLIQEIQKDTNCLNEIKYTNTKGQSRKITTTAIANIIKYLNP